MDWNRDSVLGDWERHLMRQKIPHRYLHSLLLEYFVVEGHRSAAEAFCAESGCKPPMDLRSMDDRVRIRKSILQGNIQKAIALVNALDASILTDDPILSFKLRKQQLIELIRDNAVDKALALAARELAPTSTTDPSLLEELEEVMALLAFPDAAAAPVGGLLSDAQREATAGLVNTAILTHQGQPTESRLPTLLKQLESSQKRLQDACVYPVITDLGAAEYGHYPAMAAPSRRSSAVRTGGGAGGGAGVATGAGAGTAATDADTDMSDGR